MASQILIKIWNDLCIKVYPENLTFLKIFICNIYDYLEKVL